MSDRDAAVALAALSACLAMPGMLLLAPRAPAGALTRLGAAGSRFRSALDEALAPLRRAGSEGRDPTRRERRRLQLGFAVAALPLGWALNDPLGAVVVAAGAAWSSSRAVVWRRSRWARSLERGAAPAATALADALASGHSVRGALAVAAGGLEGPIGLELARVAAELELGATTDGALEGLRTRCASRSVDLLVAAIRLQRRSGGNLAALLRDIARSLEDRERLLAEARGETAQARFTAGIVLAMPLGLLGLGELAAPGLLERVTNAPVGIWLLGFAFLLQISGALIVRRIVRPAT